MASDYTVGDLVAEFLTHSAGVTTAFGIASAYNIPMLDAIGRRNTIRFVMAQRTGRCPHGGRLCAGVRRSGRNLLLHRAGVRRMPSAI